MRVSRKDLDEAATAGIIDSAAVMPLWQFLELRQVDVPRFRGAHILYYFGGFIAMAALGLFIGQAWDAWAGVPMLVLALSMALLCVALTHHLLFRRGLALPAGVMITVAVSMTPLAIFSLQNALGWWGGPLDAADYHRYIDARWLFMELGTLAVAAIALWYHRLPFTVFLVALTLWYLQMDLVPFLFDNPDARWELRKLVSLIMGLATIGIAFWVDVRSGRRKDYAFWLYLAGVLAFWGGLTAMESDSEISKLFYCGINVLMLVIGAALRRRVFAVFGTLGIAAYLGHLADLFTDSLLFPVVLALIGLAIVYAGVQWQRHERKIADTALGLLPHPVRELAERAQQQG